jgi:hypothetical protein
LCEPGDDAFGERGAAAGFDRELVAGDVGGDDHAGEAAHIGRSEVSVKGDVSKQVDRVGWQ